MIETSIATFRNVFYFLWCMFVLRVCLEKGERAEFLDDDGSLLAQGFGHGSFAER